MNIPEFSYGFYNSSDGDRKYNANQISQIFDGVIQDGIFATIGDQFDVVPLDTPGCGVKLKPGKAWLDHTWNVLDTIKEITLTAPSLSGQKRIDALVIDVNSTTRTNEIMVIEGTQAADHPTPPSLTRENDAEGRHIHWQYPLAYITINGATNVVTAADIEKTVGSGENYTPFVLGAMSRVSIDWLITQWEAQWDLQLNQNQADFNGWFSDLQNELDDNQAAHLQNEIDNLITAGTTPLNDGDTLITGRVYFQYEV